MNKKGKLNFGNCEIELRLQTCIMTVVFVLLIMGFPLNLYITMVTSFIASVT